MDIHVLGDAWVKDAHGERQEPKIKAMTLLAYLALNGRTSREELVGLLWPNANGHSSGLANLRQALLRTRKLLGGLDYVEGGDYLELRAGVAVDVLELRAAHAIKDFARAASFQGELLEKLRYGSKDEDFSELISWLEPQRRALKAMQRSAKVHEVERLERDGRLKEALDMAQGLLALDPDSEDPYRHVMRLLHRLADRPGALKVFLECQERFRREMKVELSPETHALVREIRSVEVPPVRSTVPLSVVHPRVLAGREHEWRLMTRAWEERKPMIVDGEPGIGKSRLVRDFAHSLGTCLLVEGRPGDKKSRYATHIWNLSELVRTMPDAPMAPWVRRELSRLVRSLQDERLPLPQSPEEHTQLSLAVIEFLRGALEGVKVIVFDNAQYMDRESAELGIQIHMAFSEEMAAGRFPLIINVFRTSETGEWEREKIDSVIAEGLMRRVTVGLLDLAAIRQMLDGMGAPELSAEKLMVYTGGNPLFIVEVVRHLRESGSTGGKVPDDLPPPERIRLMLEQRLKRLSEGALDLAYFFAVARTNFDAVLASKVLEVELKQLEAPWRELEQAEIIKGNWFSNNLIAEVLLTMLSEPRRADLTRRIELHRPSHAPVTRALAGSGYQFPRDLGGPGDPLA
ncbi:MAG TPA: AAA family ATPase [Myxococcaceae bacterium]|nr:AAA family ATPase [Myxococcaceae bacterium]